ncbi:Nucleolar MIF4G domain-containing protein [Drosera capensis]
MGAPSSMSGDKSRKEKRKEARLSRKQHKHKAWLQKYISLKEKKNKSVTENFGSNKLRREISLLESDDERVYQSNEPLVSVATEIKVGSKALVRKRKKIPRKKTKFEEYLELEGYGGVASAEKDLVMERILAKKLKVKNGKLKDESDGLDLLFEGLESIPDSFEQESDRLCDDGREGTTSIVDKGSKKKKIRKRELETDIYGNALNTKQQEDKEVHGSSDHDEEHNKRQDGAQEMQNTVNYVAPQLSSHLKGESEDLLRIRRRIRGLLNRLSESNVESITGEVFTIFQSVSRSTASQIISEEVLASCSVGPRGNEQYAAVFAAFVAGMACMAGRDFGAKLLASLAKCFEVDYSKEDNLSLRNVTLFLSYLCIFGVCSSDLIYDFLDKLSEQLTEIDVSTILSVLQSCGMKIRGDDPAAMKSFIVSVQSKVNQLKSEDDHAAATSKRMEFMLETICDIKNNKRRSKDDTPQHLRIKKWLQKVGVFSDMVVVSSHLRVEDVVLQGISWSKLLDPDKKGQWWLSGELAPATANVEEVANKIDTEVHEAQKMLQIAASQRMNTDIRRGIFCVIMSGEDYLDAFEKLLRLDLQGKQDREVMRVLVQCCLQEKVFNKYYTALASKLCSHDKNHKFTLQFCLWDHFKELESIPLVRSMHLANFVAEMISSFTLSLAALKTVDLSDAKLLTPKRVMHFRMLFENILELPENLVWNIFTRIAVAPELEDLRTGIEFFIRTYVVTANTSAGSRFKLAKKALNNGEGILM